MQTCINLGSKGYNHWQWIAQKRWLFFSSSCLCPCSRRKPRRQFKINPSKSRKYMVNLKLSSLIAKSQITKAHTVALRQWVYPLLSQRKEGLGHFTYWCKKTSAGFLPGPKKHRRKCVYNRATERDQSTTPVLEQFCHKELSSTSFLPQVL